MKKAANYKLAGMVGNILEHYDSALFGLLAPFLAPLFFADYDPITALIMTYGIMPLGIVSRPVGALFFGWIGDRFGRKEALRLSLLGMAAITVAMGFLPVHSQVGVLAPVLLALLRMLQGFFMAGEAVGGAIYILEQAENGKKTLLSSLYDASSVGGILLASALVASFSSFGIIDYGWRFLFWGGSLTAIFGFFLQKSVPDNDIIPTPTTSIGQGVKQNLGALCAIIFTSGLSYVTYAMAFDLMNGYIPIVTTLSKTEVMKINSYLLVLDMLLLPCFGYLAYRIGKERQMQMAALFLALAAIPLFLCLESASLGVVIAVRCALVVGGVAFSAPYHAWAQELVPANMRYTILSLGYALGTQCIGKPACAISCWLYKLTGLAFAPGLYLALFASVAGYVVISQKLVKRCRFYQFQ